MDSDNVDDNVGGLRAYVSAKKLTPSKIREMLASDDDDWKA